MFPERGSLEIGYGVGVTCGGIFQSRDTPPITLHGAETESELTNNRVPRTHEIAPDCNENPGTYHGKSGTARICGTAPHGAHLEATNTRGDLTVSLHTL